jgi:tetratricopeptide (TPR) repeat protein
MSNERSSQEMKALFHEAARSDSAPPAAWVLAQAQQPTSRLPYLLAPLAVVAGFALTLVLFSGGPGSDPARSLPPVPADTSGRPIAATAGGAVPVSAPSSSLTEKAKIALTEERYEDAALLLDKAQAETPDDPEVLRLRAMLFQLTGKVNEACEAMKQFVAIAPEMAAAKHFATFIKEQNATRYPACGEGERGPKTPQEGEAQDSVLAENKTEEAPDKKKTANAKTALGKTSAIPDSDKDTVPDVSDSCPFQAGKPSNEGCPPSKTPKLEGEDTDRDGIPNKTDKCPNDTSNSCKEAVSAGSEKDSDGDGILDGLDKCPTDKKNKCAAGAPPPTEKDSDGDGILDGLDACPTDKTNTCAAAGATYEDAIYAAQEAYVGKDYSTALKALDEANKKKPGDLEVLRIRAFIYQGQGNTDKACAAMKKYIAAAGEKSATSFKFISYMDSQDTTKLPSCQR